MEQMIYHERAHVFDHFQGRSDTLEKSFCERPAGRLMLGAGPAQLAVPLGLLGRAGLAEIMGEHSQGEEPSGCRRAFAPRVQSNQSIETVTGMNEDIAFRVPLGFLR